MFTSDHGELLGEQDCAEVFGHGHPLTPELVEVPTVFVGAGLPGNKRLADLISGTDLAPTLLGAQGRAVPNRMEGVDLWHESTVENRVVRSEMWANTGTLTYAVSSAWDNGGGLVRHLNNRFERLAFAVDRNFRNGAQVPANRTGLPGSVPSILRLYGKSEITYGTTEYDYLRDTLVTHFTDGQTDYELEGPDKDQLAALGYVE